MTWKKLWSNLLRKNVTRITTCTRSEFHVAKSRSGIYFLQCTVWKLVACVGAYSPTQPFAWRAEERCASSCTKMLSVLLSRMVRIWIATDTSCRAFRCYSRVISKPGMHHFLCTAHHDSEVEVITFVTLFSPYHCRLHIKGLISTSCKRN